MDRRALLLSLAVFAGVLVPGAALVELRLGLDRAERRRVAADLAAAEALTLEQQLSGSLAAAHALAAAVREVGGEREFDRIAAELAQVYPGVDSLQLAPGGVLRHIFPLAGNEAALGIDLFNDPHQAPDVEAAKATRRLVLTGPFTLRQGGIGLAGRVAVFVRTPAGERFWGIATALVRLPRLLEASRIRMLSEAGYDWELTRRRDGGVEVIAQAAAGAPPLKSPVSVAMRVPNGDWTLGVRPRAGWSTPGQPIFGFALVLLADLAFALLAYRELRQPALLRRQVAARTAELERALRDQRAAEEALRQGQKMEAVGRLAGGIAHDFNNILQAILGYTGAVAASPELSPAMREDLKQSLEAAERAATLTRQLLAFGRRQILQPARLDLNEVIASLMKMLTRIIGEHIELRIVPGHDLGAIWADRGQIEQVLMNLCVNARDAMPGGGALTIETENVVLDGARLRGHPQALPGRYVALRVGDTGSGIAPELLPHIFEPFFTTKETGKGTGLGLSTIHGIVLQHRGAIDVWSRVGRGSTFEVFLPAVEGRESAGADPIEGPVRGGRETILLAEDDPAVRALASRFLEEAGYTVLEAADGRQALDLAASSKAPVDLAVLDVVMPWFGGRQVQERLAELRPGLKVLFASGYGETMLEPDFLAREDLRLLRKPYSREALLRAIRRALDT